MAPIGAQEVTAQSVHPSIGLLSLHGSSFPSSMQEAAAAEERC